MRVSVTQSITAQNTFTDWAQIDGVFQLLVYGLSDSTVTLQGSPDAGVTVYDIEEFSNASTDNTLHVGTMANSNWLYRAGVKTGDYGTDTITVRLEA